MIDTIVLTLTKDYFVVSEPDKFSPSARWVENYDAAMGRVSKQNSSKQELSAGIYRPRLTLRSRINHKDKPELLLKIELSLPKLLFGNNFDELQFKDFTPLVQKLKETLASMGVIVTLDALKQAPVHVIHYSKNIPLTDGTTPFHYINKIKEVGVRQVLDVNQTDFRNGGYSYKWHCNAYEVAFYDKIKDLEAAKKGSKRLLEKDNAVQLMLYDKFQNRKRFEVLRMEVRLTKRQKIKELFKALDIPTNLTFKSLFKPAMAKKVLLHYLAEIESKRPPLIDYRASNDEALFVDLIFNNPGMNTKRLMQVFGFKKALALFDARELRRMLAHTGTRSWYRLMADVELVKLPVTRKSFDAIREAIVLFKPLKLK